MSRWREIGSNPKFKNAALEVACNIGEAIREWDDPRSQFIGAIIISDMLDSKPDDGVQARLIFALPELVQRLRFDQKTRMPQEIFPPPATIMLKIAAMALNPHGAFCCTEFRGRISSAARPVSYCNV